MRVERPGHGWCLVASTTHHLASHASVPSAVTAAGVRGYTTGLLLGRKDVTA